MDRYICTICDYIYDPALGDPDSGIAPGTCFNDLPDDLATKVPLFYYSDISDALIRALDV